MIRKSRYVVAGHDLAVDAVDALYVELRGRKAELVKPLRDEPWGMREFGIRSVDGHRIMFGAPKEAARP